MIPLYSLTNERIIAWLGRQFWNQTFEDDVEVKIDEIRELLDLSVDCGEASGSESSAILAMLCDNASMSQKRKEIKHVWFDLDGTLSVHTPEFHQAHDQLRYKTYAEATGRPLTAEIGREYERVYKEKGTNSAVFRSLGLPTDYWMSRFNTLDKNDYYRPIPEIFETLEKLKEIVPISLFTNDSAVGTAKTLKVINVNVKWFTYLITGDEVPERKPDLHGFQLAVEKSKLPAEQILYVGDRVNADVRPAKSVGMQTCLVYSHSDEADYSCDKFEQILTLFS
jgi:putative hydrolase of the HAD superfamily